MTVTARKNVFPDLLGEDEPNHSATARKKSQRKAVPVREISFPDQNEDLDEEDDLLDVLLDEEFANDDKPYFYDSDKKAPSETTCSTSSSNLTPPGHERPSRAKTEFARTDSGSHQSASSESESSNSGSGSDMSNQSAKSLLARAQDRIAMTHLHDEIEQLKAVLDKKNKEIENLNGQLRRAISTKCDLVLAHTELERRHENELMLKDVELKELEKSGLKLKEDQNEAEQNLLSELVQLSDSLKEAEDRHKEELEDWERLHKNEMLEKDFRIAQLQVELRKMCR